MIQKHIVNRGKRTVIRQFFHLKQHEDVVAGWRSDLGKIRRVFQMRSFIPAYPTIIYSLILRPDLQRARISTPLTQAIAF